MSWSIFTRPKIIKAAAVVLSNIIWFLFDSNKVD